MLIIRALYLGLFTGIVVAIPIGPAGIESIRLTISKGLKQGVLVVVGSLIADAIDVMLINFGILDLIEKSRLLEVLFWLISGITIFYIGYRTARNNSVFDPEKNEEFIEHRTIRSHELLTGFLICVSNPMTHFFWLTLSSTVLRVWRSAGKLPYFVFTVSMLSGMFLTLCTLNYLAHKGLKIKTPKVSGRLNKLLSYGIAVVGAGFFLFGVYKLYALLTFGSS